MSSLRMIGVLVLILAAQAVRADPCKVSIEANDNMQFNMREIVVPSTCEAVEGTDGGQPDAGMDAGLADAGSTDGGP